MKLEPRIILNLFIHFSNFETQYSYQLYSYKKCMSCKKVCAKYQIHSQMRLGVKDTNIEREKFW